MANVAIIQAKPSKMSINKYFPEIVSGHTVTNFSLTDNPDLKKVLVRDTNIQINVQDFDYIILIGTEPLKYFSSKTSITECSGSLVPSNVKRFGEHKGMLAITNPFAMIFRPEAKEPFDLALSRITDIINGVSRGKAECFYNSSMISDSLIFEECDEAERTGVLSMDSETTSFHIHKGHIIGLCLSHQPFQGTYTHADVISDAALHRIQQVLDNPKVDIVGHNMKFDLKFFTHHFSLDFTKAFAERRVHDTMLMHYLLDERKGHGLKQLANKFTDMGNYDDELDAWKKNYCKENKMSTDDFTYDLIPWDIIQEYGCMDADATIRLYHKFLPVIRKNAKINWVYDNIMMPGMELFAEMEMNGIPVSVERAKKVKDYLTKRMHEALEKIYDFDSVKRYEADFGDRFNPGSPVQLRKVLFDYEGLTPTGILTDTGEISTNAEALEQLKSKSPLVSQIAEYRRISKIIGTYLTNMIDNIDSDGRLRCSFNQHIATSGRLSSSGFINLQNLPARGLYGSAVKGCVVAPEGWTILAADLTAAEVYYAAVVSDDEAAKDVFRRMNQDPVNNPDPHSIIAFDTFPVKATKPSEVKAKDGVWRQASKGIQFSALFGSGPESLAEYINKELMEEWHKNPDMDEPKWYTKEDAEALLAKYFKRFFRLKQWITETHSTIVNKGFLYSMVGRKRRAFNHKSPDRSVVAEEQRSCLNAMIQGLSSDCLVLGMVAAYKEIRARELQNDIKFLMTVHDSVILLVRDGFYDIAKEILVRNCQTEPQKVGCSIDGAPIGMEVESGESGSRDYSLGKFDKEFGFLFEEAA